MDLIDAPPHDFNPLTATDDVLASQGFPPRPPQAADGSNEGLPIWQDIMGAIGIDQYQPPPPTDELPKHRHLESRTWAGGIVPPQESQPPVQFPPVQFQSKSEFYFITSTWNIPTVSPPDSRAASTQDRYAVYDFVAFDGWIRPGPPALMWGTKSIYDNGKHCAKIFLQYELVQYTFDRPCVQPGDVVSAILWINPDRKTFGVFLVNRRTRQYIRFRMPLPDDFKGATAEWILGRQQLDYGNPGDPKEVLPDFDPVSYRLNLAISRGGWYTVDNASLIDMVASYSGQIIARAEKVGRNLLRVFRTHYE